jgi:hypothetical protein
MTRYLALYYGRDAQFVGPVRSGRLIDPQLTLMYGGLLGMVGADRYVWGVIQDALPGRFISQRLITCPALCREEESGQVFADTAAFTEYVQQLGLDNERPSIEGLRFDEEPAFRGEEATKLWIYYSYYNQVEWTYSSEQGVFLRSQEVAQEDKTVLIEPMTDRLTGEQLAFNNVVVLFAPHHEMQPELIEIDLWGADMQRAIMFRDGMIYEAFYSAISSTRPLRFYTSEGDLFTLKPGATWFEIVGLGSALEEVAPGSWKLRFYR